MVALAWIITLSVLVFAAVFIFVQQKRISDLKSGSPHLSLKESHGFQSYTERAFGMNMKMLPVSGGTFIMGCTTEQGFECFADERPKHQVTLSDYYIGTYPVTQRQWELVMGSNPSRNKDCPDCPVENVSWRDAMNYIRKLNLETGMNYSLPTEAQWEYAARGGQNSNGSKFAGHGDIYLAGWFNLNSQWRTNPVGNKSVNSLGLYDMSGNVWEWCRDWYGSYNSDDKINPIGPASGAYRVLRGGSWSNLPRYCRVSARQKEKPNRHTGNIGFRLVREIN